MKAERSIKVNGSLIEQFYWHGKMVVYINNRLFKGTFDEAVTIANMPISGEA